MSQPFTLYDADGNALTLHSPLWAEEEVKAGRLFREPPGSQDEAAAADIDEDGDGVVPYEELTVDEVLALVREGTLTPAEALDREKAGKGRVTLLRALEDMQGEG